MVLSETGVVSPGFVTTLLMEKPDTSMSCPLSSLSLMVPRKKHFGVGVRVGDGLQEQEREVTGESLQPSVPQLRWIQFQQ
jgi:hypothetical protein